MITEHHLERDGERLLLRLMVHQAAALDVLTDRDALRAAAAMLGADSDAGLSECRLGTFGPFDVVVSTHGAQIAIAIDGPDLGAFRGDQSVVFYVGRDELLEILTEG